MYVCGCVCVCVVSIFPFCLIRTTPMYTNLVHPCTTTFIIPPPQPLLSFCLLPSLYCHCLFSPAFTELQTELQDVVNVQDKNYPYRDFRSFAMKFLFPTADDDHPILKPVQVRMTPCTGTCIGARPPKL